MANLTALFPLAARPGFLKKGRKNSRLWLASRSNIAARGGFVKKQIASIRPQVIRGTSYVLSLLGVCLMPFAFAERTTRAQTSSANAKQLPTTSSNSERDVSALRTPNFPTLVLYDQYNNPATEPPLGIGSQEFEPAMAAFNDQAADDFVVTGGPPGFGMCISSVRVMGEYSKGGGPASSFNVYIYTNAAGNLPGFQIGGGFNLAYTGTPPDFTINLPSPFCRGQGTTYWLSVQAVQDFNPNGQWFWHNRTALSNAGAAWQNPGDGYGTGCTSWNRKNACMPDQVWPDQVFQIIGFFEGNPQSPTPTATIAPTPTITPTCTPSVGKIYNIGGFGASGVTNTTRIYDIGTDTWTIGAPCPAALSEMATAYYNGKIYVAGGYNGSGATNTLYIYDIATNSWTNGANTLQAVFAPGFGIINGKLYVAGGNSGSVELNASYMYDIASNTWTQLANVPTAVTGPGSAAINGRLYLFGGGFPTTRSITQIFDPVLNSWSICGNMNVNRLWFYGGASSNTGIVAAGGDQQPGTPIADNERGGCAWTVEAPLPYPARGAFVVSDGAVVYIGGGYDGSSAHTDTLRYDPVANTYTPLAPAPDPHYLSQAVLVSVPCGTPTPTATFTPTATATFTSTPTATATPLVTVTASPTATATATPRPSITPRPTATPRPRPTPAPRS